MMVVGFSHHLRNGLAFKDKLTTIYGDYSKTKNYINYLCQFKLLGFFSARQYCSRFTSPTCERNILDYQGVFKFKSYISTLPFPKPHGNKRWCVLSTSLEGFTKPLETPNFQTNSWVIHLKSNYIFNVGRDHDDNYVLIN